MSSASMTDGRALLRPTLDTAESLPAEGEVESPSLSTPQARARFEFEPKKGNDGTKVVMVEWEDDDSTRDVKGSWTVSWEGKSAVLPAEERSASNEAQSDAQAHRLFFLLPAGALIPALITLTLQPSAVDKETIVWQTNPLPAIFPPGFAESAVGSSKPSKGVLHTLWAKKRLRTLQSEIDKEEKLFPEGIGLAMAVQEKEWIEENFGLGASETTSHRQTLRNLGDAAQSPSSPMSPGGSRLSEKLKGLKLQTIDGSSRQGSGSNPLSPEEADVAVPSFSAFGSANPGILAAKPAQKPPAPPTVRSILPQVPTGQSIAGAVGSLAEMISGAVGIATVSDTKNENENEDEEEELFAMPLSPRSPEMTTSPFSFAQSDTAKYVKSDHAQPVL